MDGEKGGCYGGMSPQDRDGVGTRMGEQLAVVRGEEESRQLRSLIGVEESVESLCQEKRR